MSLVENVSTDQFEGRVYAISEANLDKRKSRNMNELSEQLSDPPRQFLIHDSRKIVFYNKQRPVDILYELLLGVNGDVHTNQQPFTAFFERYGRDQACAMCLSIISGVYGDLSPQQCKGKCCVICKKHTKLIGFSFVYLLSSQRRPGCHFPVFRIWGCSNGGGSDCWRWQLPRSAHGVDRYGL